MTQSINDHLTHCLKIDGAGNDHSTSLADTPPHLNAYLIHSDDDVRIYRRLSLNGDFDSLDFHISGKSNVDVDNFSPLTTGIQPDLLVLRIKDKQCYLITPATRTQVMSFFTSDENDVINLALHLSNPCEIHAGGGDDHISSGASFAAIYGGPGDDDISITQGRAYVHGEEGDDHIYSLNEGHVSFHGGPGDDTLAGSRGAAFSYLDGGTGDNTLIGGSGPNVIVGGPGNDQIDAGESHNVIYTGDGYNQVEKLKPTDFTYHNVKSDLTVDCTKISPEELDKLPPGQLVSHDIHVEPRPFNPTAFKINGSAGFVDRAKDDFRLLLASPTGQALLSRLEDFAQASAKPYEINELAVGTNAGFIPLDPQKSLHAFIANGQAGTPSYGGSIWYSVLDVMGDSPSVIALFHELCHAYNYATGTLLPGTNEQTTLDHYPPVSQPVKNSELQAVGLPTNAAPFDFDGDPATPPTNTNPEVFSENGLRKELGLPLRTRY
ncbi:M91 family zinc metallopeptidase [Pseudomonas tritici]|uniref:M91 family zinc metallopeptidase n=1 Tax=Pseudomonas tritici TaxID=2745518 RepID=UPI00387B84CB